MAAPPNSLFVGPVKYRIISLMKHQVHTNFSDPGLFISMLALCFSFQAQDQSLIKGLVGMLQFF